MDESQLRDPAGGRGRGHGPSSAEPEPEVVYEPFDGRKRARVEDLTREEEDLLREIARLKRGVPGAAAAAWADAARRGVREDEDALAAANAGGGGGRVIPRSRPGFPRPPVHPVLLPGGSGAPEQPTGPAG